MPYDLPKLDFSEDVEKYDAFNESKEVEFTVCNHKDTKISQGKLRCTCGCAWQAPIDQLLKLQELLLRR